MKRLLTVVLSVLIVLSAFAGSFTPLVETVLTIAKKCQENLVFTEELYDLKTEKTWAIATYIPLESNLLNLVPFVSKENVNGFIVIQITDPATLVAVKGYVKLMGKSKYEDKVVETWPDIIYLITDNYYVGVSEGSYSSFSIVTDKKELVLFLFASDLASSSDYIVSLQLTKSVASWKIRRNSLEHKKFKEIIKELGY